MALPKVLLRVRALYISLTNQTSSAAEFQFLSQVYWSHSSCLRGLVLLVFLGTDGVWLLGIYLVCFLGTAQAKGFSSPNATGRVRITASMTHCVRPYDDISYLFMNPKYRPKTTLRPSVLSCLSVRTFSLV